MSSSLPSLLPPSVSAADSKKTSSLKNTSGSSNERDRNFNSKREMYLYEIPKLERQNICKILDEMNVWEDLALKYMGYEKSDLKSMHKISKIGQSPSGELLTKWENHTVNELYYLLYLMRQEKAMDTIKQCVDPVFHKFQGKLQTNILRNESKASYDNSSQPDFNQLLNNSDNNDKMSYSTSTSHQHSSSAVSSTDTRNDTTDSEPDLFKSNQIHQIARSVPEINYLELKDSTNKWDERQILGRGGFGTVYHGLWKYLPVAVKRIQSKASTKDMDAMEVRFHQSLNELKYLNSCRHDNILPLYGYSINGDEPCLVYQYMPGGSLEQRLHTKNNFPLPLQWYQRLIIAKGAARGLFFLHTFQAKPLIHADIKPANILLDTCLHPKIGDFGLAREGPNSLNELMKVSKVFGTRPYLPEEFLRSKALSTKVDVYSFGIVLLELISGLPAYDQLRKYKLLKDYFLINRYENMPIEKLMDPKIPADEFGVSLARTIFELCEKSVSKHPNQRPEMLAIMENIIKIKNPMNPYYYDG